MEQLPNNEYADAAPFRKALLRFSGSALENARNLQEHDDRPNVYYMMDPAIENPTTDSYYLRLEPLASNHDIKEIRIFYPKDHVNNLDEDFFDEMPATVWYKLYYRTETEIIEAELIEVNQGAAIRRATEIMDEDDMNFVLAETLTVELIENMVDVSDATMYGLTTSELSDLVEMVKNQFAISPVKRLRH